MEGTISGALTIFVRVMEGWGDRCEVIDWVLEARRVGRVARLWRLGQVGIK